MQGVSRKIQIKYNEVISKWKLSHYSQNSLLFSSEGHLTVLQAPGILPCEKLGKDKSSPYLEQYTLCKHSEADGKQQELGKDTKGFLSCLFICNTITEEMGRD